MISSNVTGLGGVAMTALPEAIEVRQIVPNKTKESEVKPVKVVTVEQYVRNYFSDIPIMIEIAKCESHFRQHDEKGDILRGVENNLDRGVMQINEFYHNEDAQKIGYDILTLEGNTGYARYLYEKYGVSPWKSSMKCWSKTDAYADYKQLAVQK